MSQNKAQHQKIDLQLEKLQQQIAELTEALQRERADAVNLRRRHDEQMSSLKNAVKKGNSLMPSG